MLIRSVSCVFLHDKMSRSFFYSRKSLTRSRTYVLFISMGRDRYGQTHRPPAAAHADKSALKRAYFTLIYCLCVVYNFCKTIPYLEMPPNESSPRMIAVAEATLKRGSYPSYLAFHSLQVYILFKLTRPKPKDTKFKL